jgi:hypothetical protein
MVLDLARGCSQSRLYSVFSKFVCKGSGWRTMEEMTIGSNKKVVQMSITDPKNICDYTVPSYNQPISLK